MPTSALLACLALIAVCVTPATTGSAATSQRPGPVYLNLKYTFPERAADLVSRITLDEKALQLSSSTAPAIPRLGLQSYSYWNESQHGIYFLQGADPSNGWPRFFNRATAPSFPTNLSASLSWNPTLIHRQASAISDEIRGFNDPDLFGQAGSNIGESATNYGSLFHFNPTVELQRDPRWGRTDEAFGEDPFLVGRLAGAYLNGFNGRNLAGRPYSRYLKAVSTLKHYALNNVEEKRTAISSDADEATIRDYYTAQYRTLIEDYGATGLMSAYNAVNGTPAVADTYLLNVLARRTWGFNGYVTSDCGAVATTHRDPDTLIGPGGPVALYGHGWAPPGWSTDGGGTAARWNEQGSSREISGEAGGQAFALRAGTDINCAGAGIGNETVRAWFGTDNDPENIREAIAAGVLSEDVIDRALLRVFTLRMKTGEFDPRRKVPYTRIGKEVIDSPAHRKLAQDVAEASLVLLQNDPAGPGSPRVLPVDPAGIDSAVVLGDLAGKVTLGGYSGRPTEEISPRKGIEDFLAAKSPDAQVTFDAAGTSTTGAGPATLAPGTVAEVENADLVVIVVGTDQNSNNEGSDRASINMPESYSSLIDQVAATGNRNVVLYVQAAGPISLGEALDSAPAILYAAPNGQRQGAALARTIFGRNNPSGRLSFTWFKDDSQLPPMDEYDITPESTGGLGRTYQYFTGAPDFAFGHGLGYSEFGYSKIRIGNGAGRPGRFPVRGGTVPIAVTVRNRGPVRGSTVIQIYAGSSGDAGGRSLPAKRLVGFARVSDLPAGKSRRVRLRIPVERLSLFDPARSREVVYKRPYRFEVGSSSERIFASRNLDIGGPVSSRVKYVTVAPERLVLKPGQRMSLHTGNRWLKDTTGGKYAETAAGVVEAVREDESFVNLRRAKLRYGSNRPAVVAVNRRGVVVARRPGVATIAVRLGRTPGRTVIVVRR
jgi:beta-glucosidase-like glycosyl hydrolase